jgi:hypothetical protein
LVLSCSYYCILLGIQNVNAGKTGETEQKSKYGRQMCNIEKQRKKKNNVRHRKSHGTHKDITRQAFKTKKKHCASEIRLNGSAKKERGALGLHEVCRRYKNITVKEYKI